MDLALWDLLGKYVEQPLYRVSGRQVPRFDPDLRGARRQDSRRPAAQRSRGVGARILGRQDGPEQGFGHIGHRTRSRRVGAVGSDGQLLVDSLGAYKVHEARSVGAQLDELPNIGWWEDALLPEDIGGYAELNAALKTPICAGEEVSNRYQFRDLFAARAVDIINPDVCRAGGVTECRKIAVLADVHGVLWSPHVSTGTALYLAASTHLAVHTPNAVIMEGGTLLERPFGNDLLREPLEWRPGEAHVPERPGIGVEFDERKLERYRVG